MTEVKNTTRKTSAHSTKKSTAPKSAEVAKKVEASLKSHKTSALTPSPQNPSASSHNRYDFAVGVGRRKEAVARVRVLPKGRGDISINAVALEKYFPTFDAQLMVKSPLKLIGLENQVDVGVKVTGGGKYGQAVAVRHGISRALLQIDKEFKKQLRTAGFLTRDARVKERKKPGLKKARRGPQFSKR